jgi:Tat protein translocase TatC
MALREKIYLHEERMTFGEHLEELRVRIVYALLALGGAVLVTLFFQDPLMTFMLGPHRKASNDRVTKIALLDFERAEPVVAAFPARLKAAPAEVCLAFLPEIERERELATHVRDPLASVVAEARAGTDEQALATRVTAFADALGRYVSATIRREMAKSETTSGTVVRFERIKERFARLMGLQGGRLSGFWSDSAAERIVKLLPAVEAALDDARARALTAPGVPSDAARAEARAIGEQIFEALGRVEAGIDTVEKDKGAKVVAVQYTEQFFTYMKIAFIAGIFLASPLILYHMWRFIGAGLYRHEQRIAVFFVPFSVFLFLSGCFFGYFLLIPWGLSYLGSYGDPELVDTMLSIGSYLSLFLTLTLVLGLVFQVPLVMFFLAKAGIVKPETFSRMRRIQILATFVVAAVLTPPDPFTQSMLAVPIVILYEIGIIASRAAVRWTPARDADAEAADAEEEDD